MDFKNRFFVELGTGDGVNPTSTRYFEEHKNWIGILIDPVLENLVSYLRNRKNSQIFLVACVSLPYPKKYINLIHAG